MGLSNFFPCCGRRKDKIKDVESSQETANLIPPQRAESIISHPDGAFGYGAADPNAGGAPAGGLSEEQRLRIEAIGREVGNHMLPIHALPPGRTSPSLSLSRAADPNAHNRPRALSAAASTDSRLSSDSRPSSPSPSRPDTSPPDGTLRSPHKSAEERDANAEAEDGGEGVVRKTIHLGALGAGGRGGGRKPSGRGKGKAARGKGKK